MSKIKKMLKELTTSNLYTRYSNILSLSDIPLFLIDISGDILFEFIPSPSFCTIVCKENVNQVCNDYKYRLSSNEESRFVCKHGLENILLPIVVNNETIAYAGGLQVYLKETEHQKYMIDINSFNENSPEHVAKSISSLNTVDLNKIKIHEQLCRQITKDISLDLCQRANNSHSDIERLSIEKELLEKKIIDLEAKNMSLVVNPHFLFNTLTCIARVAYFEKSHTTEELIYCLSDLLRYNLKQDYQLHTLGAEIDNIEKYLYIQKARFKNRLEYEISVPENLKSYRIPNMIIQPILENAIIHGITPKRDGGKVCIYAKEVENDMVISIIDNGNGFSKDVLQKIQSYENKSGLGFWSTDKRLKQQYGQEYGLNIIKSDYSGTIVNITIPSTPIVR